MHRHSNPLHGYTLCAFHLRRVFCGFGLPVQGGENVLRMLSASMHRPFGLVLELAERSLAEIVGEVEASEVRGSVELSLRLWAGSSCLKSVVPTAAQRTAHARLGTTRPCT